MDSNDSNNTAIEATHFSSNPSTQFVSVNNSQYSSINLQNVPSSSNNTHVAPILKPISENDIKAIRKSGIN